MEPTIDQFNDNEPTEGIEVEDFDTEELRAEATEDTDETVTDERKHGRGRRGRRRFGPNRPYRFALFVEEDGTYVLRSPDLADRSKEMTSLDELGAALQAAIEERTAEDAAAAAEAEKDAQFSGKFVLRLPRSMHRQLTELAEAEGVSLNQLALGFLAEGMGRAEMIHEFGERRGKHRGPRGGGRGPGGRGPWGRGREGFGPEGFGPEGRSSEDRNDPRRFEDRPEWWGRGPRGGQRFGHEGRGVQGHGLERRGRFDRWASDTDASSSTPEQNETSFV